MPREPHALHIVLDTREQTPLFRPRRDGRAEKGEVVARFEHTPPLTVEVEVDLLTQLSSCIPGAPAQIRAKNILDRIGREPVCPSPAATIEDMTDFPAWVRSANNKKWNVTVTCDTLPTGDYSLRGFEERICIDRKSGFPELAANFTVDRDRFEREFERMRSYDVALIVVEEGSLDQLEAYYSGGMNPKSLRNSILAWQAKYRVPFVFPGSRAKAQDYILEELVRFAERNEREMKRLIAAAKEML